MSVPPLRPAGDAPPHQRRAKLFAANTNLILWPGIGHFFVGRRMAGLLWAGGSFGLILATPLHVLLPITGLLGFRLLSALEVWFGSVRFTDTRRTVPWVLVGLAVAYGLIVLERNIYIRAFTIPGGTMIPTLVVGDHLFVNQLTYWFGDVERGDLAVFDFPCQPDHAAIERVIGLPGDTIEVRCDVVYVNGRALSRRLVESDASYWDRDLTTGSWQSRSASRYSEVIDGVAYEIVDQPERQSAGPRDFPVDMLPGCNGDLPAGRIVGSASTSAACAPRQHYVVPDGHVFVLADNRHHGTDSRDWGPVRLEFIRGRAISVWWSSTPPRQGGVRWERVGGVH